MKANRAMKAMTHDAPWPIFLFDHLEMWSRSFVTEPKGRLKKNAIYSGLKLQNHYMLMLAAFWYILKGCKIVARKRYQRHVFVQIA